MNTTTKRQVRVSSLKKNKQMKKANEHENKERDKDAPGWKGGREDIPIIKF